MPELAPEPSPVLIENLVVPGMPKLPSMPLLMNENSPPLCEEVLPRGIPWFVAVFDPPLPRNCRLVAVTPLGIESVLVVPAASPRESSTNVRFCTDDPVGTKYWSLPRPPLILVLLSPVSRSEKELPSRP